MRRRLSNPTNLVLLILIVCSFQSCGLFSYRHRLGKKVQLPPPAKHPEAQMEFSFAKWYDHGTEPSLIYFQTNAGPDSLWIYDYYHGWQRISRGSEAALRESNSSVQIDSLLGSFKD